MLCVPKAIASLCAESMPYNLQDLQPRLTKNFYVLTNHVVPPDRIRGVWSLISNAWIQKPTLAEFARMDDPQLDIDLVMHIAHQQQYWLNLKRQENDRNRITWSRKQYLDHGLVYLTNSKNLNKVFTAWRSQKEMPKTPRQPTSNPNEKEDKKRQKLKEEVIKRLKTAVQEEIETPQGADKRPARKRTSANPRDDTDSDSSVQVTSRTIAAKARPKVKTILPGADDPTNRTRLSQLHPNKHLLIRGRPQTNSRQYGDR